LVNKKFPAFSRMKQVSTKTKEIPEKSVEQQKQQSSVGVTNTSSSSSSTATRQSLPVNTLPHQQQQQQQPANSKPKGFSFLGSVSSLKNQQNIGQSAATRGKATGPTQQQKPTGFSFLNKNDTAKQNADFIPFTSSLSTGIGRNSIPSSSSSSKTIQQSTGSGSGSGIGSIPNLIELEKMNKKKKKLEKK
jgi:hypothetical protein